ncbi:MAG: glycosyltransferase [Candidatus Aenigmatarchaeota archaeon]
MEKIIEIRKKKKPLISVIIPTLNEEKYIRTTLIAVSNQTLDRNKYEIIICDSNSKDRTIEIAKKYADKIIITDRKGIAVGRNLGAKYAKGKFLVFIDADTIILPNTLEECLKYFKEYDLIYPRVWTLDSSFIYSFFYFIYNLSILLLKYILPQAGGFFIAIKKEVFQKVNGFNENLTTAEDLDLIKRVSKIAKVGLAKFPVITSTRRFEKEGRIKMAFKYTLFFFLFNLFGIYMKNYKPVR